MAPISANGALLLSTAGNQDHRIDFDERVAAPVVRTPADLRERAEVRISSRAHSGGATSLCVPVVDIPVSQPLDTLCISPVRARLRPDARCRVWITAPPTTKNAVRLNGERGRSSARDACPARTSGRGAKSGVRRAFQRRARSGARFVRGSRCGYPAAAITRSAVYFNGERRRPVEPGAGLRVGWRCSSRLRGSRILTALVIACIARAPAAVWISGHRKQSTRCGFHR